VDTSCRSHTSTRRSACGRRQETKVPLSRRQSQRRHHSWRRHGPRLLQLPARLPPWQFRRHETQIPTSPPRPRLRQRSRPSLHLHHERLRRVPLTTLLSHEPPPFLPRRRRFRRGASGTRPQRRKRARRRTRTAQQTIQRRQQRRRLLPLQ
jgi:hypothetical protein